MAISGLFYLSIIVVIVFHLAVVCHASCNDHARSMSATVELTGRCPESALNKTNVYAHLGPFPATRTHRPMKCALHCLGDDSCVSFDICTLALAPDMEVWGLRDVQSGEDTCRVADPGDEHNCQYYELQYLVSMIFCWLVGDVSLLM
jgi:hypothetical protein